MRIAAAATVVAMLIVSTAPSPCGGKAALPLAAAPHRTRRACPTVHRMLDLAADVATWFIIFCARLNGFLWLPCCGARAERCCGANQRDCPGHCGVRQCHHWQLGRRVNDRRQRRPRALVSAPSLSLSLCQGACRHLCQQGPRVPYTLCQAARLFLCCLPPALSLQEKASPRARQERQPAIMLLQCLTLASGVTAGSQNRARTEEPQNNTSCFSTVLSIASPHPRPRTSSLSSFSPHASPAISRAFFLSTRMLLCGAYFLRAHANKSQASL
jgi:hypothetical protein